MTKTKTLRARNPSEIPPAGISRCVFSTSYMKSVDAQVDRLFTSQGKKAPFGDFRRSWWRYHCKELGGGPGACPYAERDCALAFLRVAQHAVDAKRPGAMFRVVAKDHAMKRLERKPLARETQHDSALTRSDEGRVGDAQRRGVEPGHTPGLHPSTGSDAPEPMAEDGHTLRRPISRPVRIGSLLGSYNAGPREVPAGDRDEGS